MTPIPAPKFKIGEKVVIQDDLTVYEVDWIIGSEKSRGYSLKSVKDGTKKICAAESEISHA